MTETLHQLALKNLKKLGITKGSKVRVIAKAQNNTGGWQNTWVCDMDKTVGGIYQVNDLSTAETFGVELKIPGIRTFGYPAYCLELVSNPSKVKQVKLSSQCTAKVREDVVVIKGETISFEKIKKLYETMIELKN